MEHRCSELNAAFENVDSLQQKAEESARADMNDVQCMVLSLSEQLAASQKKQQSAHEEGVLEGRGDVDMQLGLVQSSMVGLRVQLESHEELVTGLKQRIAELEREVRSLRRQNTSLIANTNLEMKHRGIQVSLEAHIPEADEDVQVWQNEANSKMRQLHTTISDHSHEMSLAHTSSLELHQNRQKAKEAASLVGSQSLALQQEIASEERSELAAMLAVNESTISQMQLQLSRFEQDAEQQLATNARTTYAERDVLSSHSSTGITSTGALQAAAASSFSMSATDQPKAGRLQELLKVFGVFDLDGSGSIEASELLQLGKMRRKLGQSKGEWSEAKNNRMVKKMDENGDGVIDGPEFSEYFEQALPQDAKAFNVVVGEFMEVAEACRERKERQREQKETHTRGRKLTQSELAPTRATVNGNGKSSTRSAVPRLDLKALSSSAGQLQPTSAIKKGPGHLTTRTSSYEPPRHGGVSFQEQAEALFRRNTSR